MSSQPSSNAWRLGVAVVAGVGSYFAVKYFLQTRAGESLANSVRRSSPLKRHVSNDSITVVENGSLSPCRGITVSEIWVYPVKGCGGCQVASAELTETGFAFDRQWVVVRKHKGQIETCAQDRFPTLRKATAEIVGKKGQEMLKVTSKFCPGNVLMIPVHMSPEIVSARPQLEVDLFGVKGYVVEEPPEAHRWFSELLGDKVCLTRLAKPREPKTSFVHQGTSCKESDRTAMHDYCTIHLITTDGIRWLNNKMVDGTVVTAHQFRPNLVVTGVPFPKEDNWKRFTVGDVSMRVAKLSGRCVTPTTNEDGIRHPLYEPTATLRKYRSCYHAHQVKENLKDRKECYMFGLDVFHDQTGIIRVGDPVSVLETQPAQVSFSS